MFPILAVVRDFLLLQNIQKGSEAYTASCSVVSGVLSWEVKQMGHGVDGSLPTSAQFKNEWSYISTTYIHLHDEDRHYLF